MELDHQDGRTGKNRLKHGLDAGFFSDAPQPHDENSVESDDPLSPNDCQSTRLTGLAASLRVLSESLKRTERAEAEMAKAREALRLRSANRGLESEAELTRLVLATELQMASLVSRHNQSRKRKRVEVEDEASTAKATTQQVSQREGSLLLSLLQIQRNLLF